MKIERLVVGLMIAFLVIAGLNLARPMESASPAIVNPTGWDVAQQRAAIDTCLKTVDTRAKASVALRGQVLKLHPAIYLHVRMILDDYTTDEKMVLLFYKTELTLYRAALK